jgi:hypothetical protein
MENIDSDKNFQTNGKIIDVLRGRTRGWPSESVNSDLVTIVLKSDLKKYFIDLPIHTESEFDLIPYQSALIGEDAMYIKTYKGRMGNENGSWGLTILSGKLNGKSYLFPK